VLWWINWALGGEFVYCWIFGRRWSDHKHKAYHFWNTRLVKQCCQSDERRATTLFSTNHSTHNVKWFESLLTIYILNSNLARWKWTVSMLPDRKMETRQGRGRGSKLAPLFENWWSTIAFRHTTIQVRLNLVNLLIWKCMRMYENIWKCMKMYEHVWKCMKMYEYVWKCMKIYENVWKYMKMYENVWKRMKMYENVWIFTSLYEYIWN